MYSYEDRIRAVRLYIKLGKRTGAKSWPGSLSNRPSTGTGWSTVLKAAGFTVPLANTTAIKKYDDLKHSGDEADARYLAALAAAGDFADKNDF